MSTFCHGVASAQSLDKSGEIVDIKGLDITSLPRTGILNYEHKSDVPGQICGKILSAKKIFSKEDCSNEHEEYFWQKCKNPFVYITAELLDDYCQSGKDAAGVFRYDHDKKDQNSHAILGFSVEGSEIPNTRKGQLITRSIARKVTLTSAPCNSQCVAELLVNTPKSQVKDDFDEIFKSDLEAVTLFKSGEGVKLYEQYLAKKEEIKKDDSTTPPEPNKDSASAMQSGATQSGWQPQQWAANIKEGLGMGKAESSWSTGKVSGDSVHYSHPEHGMVSIQKQPTGEFHVKHQGKIAGVGGVKGSFASPKEAGAHAQKYMQAISQKKIHSPKMHNVPSNPTTLGKAERKLCEMHKANGEKSPSISESRQKGTFEQKGVHKPPLASAAGGESVMGSHVRSPSAQGSGSKEMARRHAQANLKDLKSMPKPNLPKSEPEGSLKKALEAGSTNAAPSTLVNGVAYQKESLGSKTATTGAEEHSFQGTKKKDWNQRAKEEYKRWPHREKFEKFMKARMPHLADGEIRAIGRTLALKKSIDFEKSLSGLVFQKGDEVSYHIHVNGQKITSNPMSAKQIMETHGKTPKDMEKDPSIKLIPHYGFKKQ